MAYEKTPTEKLDYRINWTAHLGSGETISDSTWSATPSGLTLAAPAGSANTGTETATRLTGGTVGIEYVVANHVVTSAGQEFDRGFKVNVVDVTDL